MVILMNKRLLFYDSKFCSRQSAHSTQALIRYISRIGSSSIFVVGCPGKVGDGGGMRGENAANRDNTALPESLGGSFEKDGQKYFMFLQDLFLEDLSSHHYAWPARQPFLGISNPELSERMP